MTESPMKDHVLGIAARYNDADCEEHGLATTIERQDLQFVDMLYIAEQRAMRVLWMELGRDMSIFKTNVPTPMHFSPLERRRLATLQSLYLDGILIGWRARGLHNGT